MKKIITIVGARPQFIKASMLSRTIAENNNIHEQIIHTGQHYDANMSELFFQQMDIPEPLHNLNIGGSTHGVMTGRQLEKIEAVLLDETPDGVLVYGDTNSTLAGALAAAKLNIPVIHIEAGLRSFNRRMPEEINRILVDHMSTLLFAPTKAAVNNLKNEGIDERTIFEVGDIMYDVALFYAHKARTPDWFKNLSIKKKEFVLTTIHREENIINSQRMKNIFMGLSQSDTLVIMPMHPRTRLMINEFKINISDNIYIVDPVGYLEMIWLEINSRLIVTDSGGIQKEAYFHKVPCLTLREETEWSELCEAGWNTLVGSSKEKIAENINKKYNTGLLPKLDYGQGDCGIKILNILLKQKLFF